MKTTAWTDPEEKTDVLNPDSVMEALVGAYLNNFPAHNPEASDIASTVDFIYSLYEGSEPGYRGCDTRYHDLGHTNAASVVIARILGRARKAGICIGPDDMSLGIKSALAHDTGYIPADGEEVPGGRYTCSHVDRSIAFIAREAERLFLTREESGVAGEIVKATDIKKNLDDIRFSSGEMRLLGKMLCTADYLSQMASPSYPEKLPELYKEFAQAEGNRYIDAEDLMRDTPKFWRDFVYPQKLERECGSVYRFLDRPDGSNLYMESVERNIRKIEEMFR